MTLPFVALDALCGERASIACLPFEALAVTISFAGGPNPFNGGRRHDPEAASRRLDIQRWSYRLSKYRVGPNTKAEIVHYRREGEDVVLTLFLGLNVTEDGHGEIPRSPDESGGSE